MDTEVIELPQTATDTHRFTTIICCHCGHEIQVPVYCGNRFCPICSRPRLNRVRQRIEFLIKNTKKEHGYGFKHLTLTIRNRTDLCGMLQHLTKSFRRLRQRRLWKHHVTGGAFVFEVTSKDGYYHAHIHCIIYARFIDWKSLLQLWIDCSGGRGVYLQRIPERQIVRYLTKYISKPSGSTDIEPDVQTSLSGFRLFSPFGTWYALSSKFVMKKATCPVCGKQAFFPLDLFYPSLKSTNQHLDTS